MFPSACRIFGAGALHPTACSSLIATPKSAKCSIADGKEPNPGRPFRKRKREKPHARSWCAGRKDPTDPSCGLLPHSNAECCGLELCEGHPAWRVLCSQHWGEHRVPCPHRAWGCMAHSGIELQSWESGGGGGRVVVWPRIWAPCPEPHPDAAFPPPGCQGWGPLRRCSQLRGARGRGGARRSG